MALKKRTRSIVAEVSRYHRRHPGKTKTKTEPREIFQLAVDFAGAADILHDYWTGTFLSGRRNKLVGFASETVNSAFSIELLFKCLLTLGRAPDRRGHDLLILFDRLRPATKRRIAETFNEYATYPNPLESIILTLNLDRPRSRLLKPTVRNILRVSATAFEQWRYMYESNNFLNYCANYLTQPIIDVIRELYPGVAEPP